MIRLLLKKQICMEVGCMLGKIILVMVKKNSMDRITNYELYHMVLYNKINNVFNIRRQYV